MLPNTDLRCGFTHSTHSLRNSIQQLGWAGMVLAILCTLIVSTTLLYAQAGESGHPATHDHQGASTIAGGWEGSVQGIAYSEFNHHLAGFFVLLMGCAELSQSFRLPSLRWAGLLLPIAMLLGSITLLVWSDHEAWPVGSLSIGQTLSGHDPEIIQHKIYAVLLFLVGTIEVFRRFGRISYALWSAPLPLFAIIGGLMLFGHSHGVHPSAEKIATHHAMMGTMAAMAGSSKLLSGWFQSPSHVMASRWERLWAGLILLIGIQLLMYSE